ncbi:MAG: S-layer homology domain-containing protein [Clostridia bacterium]|nr:S-layer homology domain-containing protein [Clostridia bacterium]
MKKVFALALSVIVLAGAAAVVFADESPFSDVKTTRWSYEAIKYAVNKGYMNGIGDGKFDPTGSMTRGMVVTVLYRREGSPEVTFRNDFSDVKAGKYYSDAVIWAKDEGVVNGITETTFEPNGKITREQLATMLSRFSERCLVSVPERADLSGYPDADKIHSYAKDALAWANEANLIKGMSDGTLSPRGYATREQFATILKRFDDTFSLVYNEPVVKSHFTEPEYPLVENADVYVAVNGSDENSGTFDAPLATFAGAAAKVREIKTTKTTGDIVVAFKAGDYGPLDVVLTSEDSGTEDQRIIYCKYGDGDVIFNNGVDIPYDSLEDLTGEEKAIFNANYADSIKKADLSGRLGSYDPRKALVLGESGGLTLARFPNKYSDGTDNLLNEAGENTDDYHTVIDHTLLLKRMRTYHTMDGLLLYGYLTTGWYKDLLETDGYDWDTNEFYIPHPEQARMGSLRRLPEFDSRAWNKTAIVNVSEELDAAGEFWIDKTTGTFYVYAPEGDYHITGGGDMITLKGTQYVTFRGLDFKNCDGYMINGFGHPRGTTIDGCSFVGCAAGTMVRLDGGGWLDGTSTKTPFDITVKNSTFSTAASTGLQVDGRNGKYMFDSGSNVLIDNNYFTLMNLSEGCKGAIDIASSGPVISHNHFRRNYWEDIDFRGTVNLLAEYNVFEESNFNGDDTGALQGFRDPSRGGNLARYNLFLNIHGGTNGRYCFYLDGTSGMTVESNIFFNCQTAVMNNGNSKMNFVLNNVFISNDGNINECVVHNEGTPLFEEALKAGDMNLVYNDYCYIEWNGAFSYFNSHPEDKTKAEELWPGYFDISMDFDDWQKPEFFMNSSVLCRDNVSIKAEGDAPGNGSEEINIRYCTFENNRVYRPTENPLFVNPTIGDYRFRDGVGFPDFDFEKIGRY